MKITKVINDLREIKESADAVIIGMDKNIKERPPMFCLPTKSNAILALKRLRVRSNSASARTWNLCERILAQEVNHYIEKQIKDVITSIFR